MKVFYTLLLLLFAGQVVAQDQGMITFEEKIDIHKSLPPERQQYKDMIPQFRTTNFELYFDQNESMYLKSKDQEQDMEEGGRMRFRMGNPTRDVYKNLGENRMVDSREFMDKQFLIKGPLDEVTWKIADGQKQILDYLCLKGTYSDTADTYTAWFTPQIQISNGPAQFAGLPGMILEVDVNDGERVIKAMAVSAAEFDKEVLKEPKKGKEVTSEEFREIVREKMEEMRAERQASGGHQIIIRQ